jgi:hypothetical protein
VVIGYGQDLYSNNQGKVLWNYSGSESVTAALVNDGSSCVPQRYARPNSTMVDRTLYYSIQQGKPFWNDSISGEVVESVTSVAYSNGHIVLGLAPIIAGGPKRFDVLRFARQTDLVQSYQRQLGHR